MKAERLHRHTDVPTINDTRNTIRAQMRMSCHREAEREEEGEEEAEDEAVVHRDRVKMTRIITTARTVKHRLFHLEVAAVRIAIIRTAMLWDTEEAMRWQRMQTIRVINTIRVIAIITMKSTPIYRNSR